MERTTNRDLKEREGKSGRKENRRRKDFCCGLKRWRRRGREGERERWKRKRPEWKEEKRWGGLCWTSNRGAVNYCTVISSPTVLQPSAVQTAAVLFLYSTQYRYPIYTLYPPYSVVSTDALNLILAGIVSCFRPLKAVGLSSPLLMTVGRANHGFPLYRLFSWLRSKPLEHPKRAQLAFSILNHVLSYADHDAFPFQDCTSNPTFLRTVGYSRKVTFCMFTKGPSPTCKNPCCLIFLWSAPSTSTCLCMFNGSMTIYLVNRRRG